MTDQVQSQGQSNITSSTKNPNRDPATLTSSQSKQAIIDCNGDMEKILDKLEFLQKTTDYDAVSLLALKRYSASNIIRANSADIYSGSERFTLMMLSTAELHEQLGDHAERDTIWKTILKYRIGRKVPALHLSKAKWERSRGYLKQGISTLKAALSSQEIIEKYALESLLQSYVAERDSMQNNGIGSSSSQQIQSSTIGTGADKNMNLDGAPQNSHVNNNNQQQQQQRSNNIDLTPRAPNHNTLNTPGGPGTGFCSIQGMSTDGLNNLANSVQSNLSRGVFGSCSTRRTVDRQMLQFNEPGSAISGKKPSNNTNQTGPGNGMIGQNHNSSGGQQQQVTVRLMQSQNSQNMSNQNQNQNQGNLQPLPRQNLFESDDQNQINQAQQQANKISANNHMKANDNDKSLLLGESCQTGTSLSPILEEGQRRSESGSAQDSNTGAPGGAQGRINASGSSSSSSMCHGVNNNNNTNQNQQILNHNGNMNQQNHNHNQNQNRSYQAQQSIQSIQSIPTPGPGQHCRNLNQSGPSQQQYVNNYNNMNGHTSDEFTEPSEMIQTSADGFKIITVNGTQYRKVSVVGRGGSSKVFKVLNPEGEVFALKRVLTSNKAQFQIFKNEISLLEKLKGKPNIIQIVDSEAVEYDRLLVLMRFGESDFSKYLQSEPDIDFPEIRRYWSQMLKAVHVVHEQRIVHSDLKPANFLLVSGSLQLIDFGIAKAINNDTTNIQRDHQIGTLSYMAPEAVHHQHTGPLKLGRSSDIWSLGIILYQMVYKRTPFSHLNAMQRILAISDPKTMIDFPKCRRLISTDEQSYSELIDTAQTCLRREPTERSTIPDLLSHPFLVPQNIEKLNRTVFQRCIVSHLTKTREKLLPKLHSGTSSGSDQQGPESIQKDQQIQNQIKTLTKLERQVADSMWKFLVENSSDQNSISALNPSSMEHWAYEVVHSANAEKNNKIDHNQIDELDHDVSTTNFNTMIMQDTIGNLIDSCDPGGPGINGGVNGNNNSVSISGTITPASSNQQQNNNMRLTNKPKASQVFNADPYYNNNTNNITSHGPASISSLIDDCDPQGDPALQVVEPIEPMAKRQKTTTTSSSYSKFKPNLKSSSSSNNNFHSSGGHSAGGTGHGNLNRYQQQSRYYAE